MKESELSQTTCPHGGSLAHCSLGSCPEALLALNCVTPSLADPDHMPACARLGAGFDFPILDRRSTLQS